MPLLRVLQDTRLSFDVPAVLEFWAPEFLTQNIGTRPSRATQRRERVNVLKSKSGDFNDLILPTREFNLPPARLKFMWLYQQSLDEPIVADLGGKEKAIVPLYYIYQALAYFEQHQGEFTKLVGYVNIGGYVRAVDESVRNLSAVWLASVEAWDLDSLPYNSAMQWNAAWIVTRDPQT